MLSTKKINKKIKKKMYLRKKDLNDQYSVELLAFFYSEFLETVEGWFCSELLETGEGCRCFELIC